MAAKIGEPSCPRGGPCLVRLRVGACFRVSSMANGVASFCEPNSAAAAGGLGMSSTWPVDIFGLMRRRTLSCSASGLSLSHPDVIYLPTTRCCRRSGKSTCNVKASYRDRFHECPLPAAIRAASGKSTQFDGARAGREAVHSIISRRSVRGRTETRLGARSQKIRCRNPIQNSLGVLQQF
jgi:hypothetical protein